MSNLCEQVSNLVMIYSICDFVNDDIVLLIIKNNLTNGPEAVALLRVRLTKVQKMDVRELNMFLPKIIQHNDFVSLDECL